MSERKAYQPGELIVVENYPFIRTTFDRWVEDGCHQAKSWRPGVEFEHSGPDGGSTDVWYNGVGKQILTVVSVHKPGKYPARIFYTREWEDPDGRRFGKGSLRVAVEWKFRRLCAGYDWDAHGLFVEPELVVEAP